MKKIVQPLFLALALLLLNVACSSCASQQYPYWGQTTDQDALYAQDLMRSTVMVQQEIWADVSEYVPELGKIKLVGGGSGSVVAVRGNESLVLTANHVCEEPEEVTVSNGIVAVELSVLETIMTISTVDGQTCSVEPVYTDAAHDVCVLKVNCVAGRPAELADSLPPLGGLVQNPAAPGLVFDDNMVSVTDGRYGGLTNDVSDDEFVFYTMVTSGGMGGSSGSGLYYKGKLFSMVVMGLRSYDHAMFGVHLKYLKKGVEEAKKEWLKKE